MSKFAVGISIPTVVVTVPINVKDTGYMSSGQAVAERSKLLKLIKVCEYLWYLTVGAVVFGTG